MNYSKIYVYVFFLLASVVTVLASPAFADDQLTLSIHPYLSHEQVEKKFTPLAKYLSSKTGKSVKIKIGSSYEEHIQYVGDDKVDIAYVGPMPYVNLLKTYGAKPILAKLEIDGRSFYQGYIAVRKDSDIKTLADLKGKDIAFGDPHSTMSYLVPHHMLSEAGVFAGKATRYQFLYGHNDVAYAILSGDFDAGALKEGVFRRFKEQGLRVIAKTPNIVSHAFVVRSNMPAKEIQDLREVMLNMEKTIEGMAALRAINKHISGLTEGHSNDYKYLLKYMIEPQDDNVF